MVGRDRRYRKAVSEQICLSTSVLSQDVPVKNKESLRAEGNNIQNHFVKLLGQWFVYFGTRWVKIVENLDFLVLTLSRTTNGPICCRLVVVVRLVHFSDLSSYLRCDWTPRLVLLHQHFAPKRLTLPATCFIRRNMLERYFKSGKTNWHSQLSCTCPFKNSDSHLNFKLHHHLH